MVEERRQHQRLVPSSPLFISLEDSNSALLLDLCEGGLAVASLVPRNLDEIVSLSFGLPEGIGHVQAKAKITWTRDSGHLTGVRFVDFDGVSQQQLNEWISAGTNLRLAPSQREEEPVFVARSTYAQVDPIAQVQLDAEAADTKTSSFSEQIAFEPEAEMEPELEIDKWETATRGRERGSKSRYTIELFLAVVLLSWALVFLGYQMGSTGVSRQSQEMPLVPKVTEASTKPDLASIATRSSPTAPVAADPVSIPHASSRESGHVLQVGAMKLEDNATALAQGLRTKKLPAFVFRRDGDKLFRVAVGPLGDADSTVRMKDRLETLGFRPILQHWVGD
jgi:SPOR domain/PilZ domain